MLRSAGVVYPFEQRVLSGLWHEAAGNPMGETKKAALRACLDRRLKPEFHGS